MAASNNEAGQQAGEDGEKKKKKKTAMSIGTQSGEQEKLATGGTTTEKRYCLQFCGNYGDDWLRSNG